MDSTAKVVLIIFFGTVIVVVGLIIGITVFTASNFNADSESTTAINKENAIDISYTTQEIGKQVIIKSVKKIYFKGKIIKETQTFDTLPLPEKPTLVEEDEKGNVLVRDKNYEFYFTVN